MKKAIALIRVSGTHQASPDRMGIPVQRETCERIARTHSLSIVDWVELEGVSGAAVLADPAFQAMLGRIRSGEVGALVVAAFDRLFRRGRFGDFAILDDFLDSGTALYTADGEVKLEEESGGLLSVIRGELAGMERRRIIERTKAGRRRKRREHGVRAEGPVGMPRGVSFCQETQKWSYIWPVADQIREAFRLFLSGEHNFAEVSRRTGIGTEKDRSFAIRRLLRQPLYKGVYRVDRTWDGGRPTPLPPEEVQEHKVLDPPLVSPADWEETQRILDLIQAGRPPRRDPDKLAATYTCHMICGQCFRPMRTLRDSRGYLAYGCERRQHGCALGQVSVRAADPDLDAALERILGDATTLELLLDGAVREQGREATPSAAELSRRLTNLENRRQRAREAYEAAVYSLRDLQKREDTINAERAAVEALMDVEEPWEAPDGLVEDFVEVFASWADLRRQEKRVLLREWRLEIVASVVGRPYHRRLQIERVRAGILPTHLWLYKKMNRSNIE